MKKLLLDYKYSEIEEVVKAYSQPKFRAGQLFDWLYNGADFFEMTNLPKNFLLNLEKDYDAIGLKIIKVLESKDGSKKYLFSLSDGNLIESVFMPHDYGNSVCVSTQVGCRMRCSFCASGVDGLIRNLTAGEILSQVLLINKTNGGNKTNRNIKNIVLMGSGEPLDNYDNVIKFLGLVTLDKGINISARNISLSTSGLAPEIRQLADSGFPVTLSISLHATTDKNRNKTMPISKKYTIDEVISAAKYYFEKTGRRVIIEYIMLNDNTNFFDAKRLSELLQGFSTHVNLIPLNSTSNKTKILTTTQSATATNNKTLSTLINTSSSNIESGADKPRIERFLARLTALGISATIRKSMGGDIEGACGQLRRKFVGDKDPVSSEKKP